MPAARILNAPGYFTSFPVLNYNKDFSEVKVYRKVWEQMSRSLRLSSEYSQLLKKYPEYSGYTEYSIQNTVGFFFQLFPTILSHLPS